MLLRNSLFVFLFINISLLAQEKNIILKSIPAGVSVTIYSHSIEIKKSVTPSEIYLQGGVYSFVYSKKGYLNKKINIYIDDYQTFNEEIILEFDPQSLSKLDKEAISREENRKKVVIPKEDIIVVQTVEENIEKLNKDVNRKQVEKVEIKIENLEISSLSKEISKNEEEIPIKKGNKYIINFEKKSPDFVISGLTWDGNANKLSLSKDEAETYCKGLSKRLPTSKELTSHWKELKDFGWFWTSSVSTSPPGKVMIVSLYTGEVMNFENTDVKAYVRCVK
jgi:hypothetical protein